MVGQLALNQLIVVRIHVPEHYQFNRERIG